ncbi:ecdysone oxidase-like [Dermacentor silvarum]|uniref:ecdysone oxidase-like n=1 Tax=Dermacentor silvarum TaxID=543639 RepID=UPI0021019787|nr:ecdysone oxidase-like [Dermacentor silvarum]
MSGSTNATTCAPWDSSPAPQSELGLALALLNMVVHIPFNDLPVVEDYQLGQLRPEYDYVIGCVIANQLSEDPDVTVLLLEAGGLEAASRQVPFAAPMNLRGDDDWEDRSVPQKNAALSFHEQVNFEGTRAVGASFTRFGRPGTVSAKREVILSAGTVGSTQHLLLSGLGPKEELKQLQIPIVADLPVGRNLQDHPTLPLGVPIRTDVQAGIGPFSLEDIAQHARNRTGTIFIPASMEFLQFLVTDYATNPDIPDVEVATMSISPARETLKTTMTQWGLLPEVFDSYIGPVNGQPGFQAVTILNRPRFRGSITLRSTDPYEHPNIDPRILEHPDDARAAAQGTKIFIDKILSTDAMKSIGAKLWDSTFTPCADAGPRWSEQYIECLFRHTALPIWHLCCTVAMGSHSEAVLDERLRVRGNVTGLRVADASVMPDIVSGHTNAPSMMIGSKAADMIIEDNEERHSKKRRRTTGRH